MESKRSDTAAVDADEPRDDLSALAWVHDELRRSLEAAHKALRRHVKETEAQSGADVDAVDPAVLRTARAQLHQGVGALELVGLPAAAAVLRASEAAVQRHAARPQKFPAGVVEAVEHASFAVLDYIGRLLAGKPVPALSLFPQYRAVQEAAGAERVHPADLWPVDWQWRELPTDPGVRPRRVDAATRAALEAQLLALMRGGDPPAVAARMSELCAGLGAGAGARPAATLWKLASAVFEAQAQGLLGDDVFSKRVASRLLAQFRALERGDTEVSERLAADLLFFCAQSASPGDGRRAPRLSAARLAYGLVRHVPVDYASSVLGRHDPALVLQARKRVAAAKEAWSAVAGGEMHRLAGLAEQFSLAGDSLRRLFPLGEAFAAELQQAVAQTQQSGAAPAPSLAMEVATSLLYVEAALEDADFDAPEQAERVQRLGARLAGVRRGQPPEPLEGWIEELYRRVSDRQTMGSVVQELRASLSEVEKLIDQFFRQPGDAAVLIPVPHQLASMRGVLSVLGMDHAAAALLRMRDELEHMVAAPADAARDVDAFDRLAGNLGALGFLIDMLSVQPQLAKSLFRYDAATGRLEPVMGRGEPERAAPPAAPAPVDQRLIEQAQMLAFTSVRTDVPVEAVSRDLERLSLDARAADHAGLVATAERAREALERSASPSALAAARGELSEALVDFVATASEPHLPEPEPAARPASSAERAGVVSAPIRLDFPESGGGLEDDPEMREVFLEEAREVVEEARRAHAELNDRRDDLALLTTLRRAFHTLKGSSRMVGLTEFGDAAWSGEQVYNTQLAAQQPAGAELLDFTAWALGYLGAWVEDIAANRASAHRAAALRERAARLGEPGTTGDAAPAAGDAPPRFELAPEAAPAHATPAAADAAPVDGAGGDDALPGAEVIEMTEPSFEFTQPLGGPAWPDDLPSPADLDLGAAASAPAASAAPAAPAEPLSFAFDLDLDGPPPAAPAAAPALAAQGLFDPNAPFDAEPLPGPFESSAPTEPAPLDEAAAPDATADFRLDLDLDLDFGGEPADRPVLESLLPSAALADLTRDAPPLAAPVSEAPQSVNAVDIEVVPLDAGPADVVAEAPDAVAAPEVHPVGASGSGDADADAQADGLAGAAGPVADVAADPIAPDHGAAQPALDDDHYKFVGPLRIGIPLFNIYLNEADELSRRLGIELAEWAMELHRPIGEMPVALAHSLAGSSATVGFADLSQLARALEHAEARSLAIGHGTIEEAQLFLDAADEIRRLLHQFAAGFLKQPSPALLERLAAHERSSALRLDAATAAADLSPDDTYRPADVEPELTRISLDPALESAPAGLDDDSIVTTRPSVLMIEPSVEAGDTESPPVPGEVDIEIPADVPVPAAAAADVAPPVAEAAPADAVSELRAEAEAEPEPEREAQAQAAAGSMPSAGADAALEPAPAPELEREPDPEPAAVAETVAESAAEPAIEAASAFSPELEARPPSGGAETRLGGLDYTELKPLGALPSEPARPVSVDALPQSLEDDLDAEDAVDAELFPIFEEEAGELLPQLASQLRDWRRRPTDPAPPAACMRTLHTLKGGARLAGAMRLGEQAHRLETRVEHVLAYPPVEASAVEALQADGDVLVQTFEALRARDAQAYAEASSALDAPAGASPAVSLASLPPLGQAVPVVPAALDASTTPPAMRHDPVAEAGPEAEAEADRLADAGAAAGPEAEAEGDTETESGADTDTETPTEAAARAEPAAETAARADVAVKAPAPAGIDWSRFGTAPGALDGARTAPARAQAVSAAAVRVRAPLLDRLVNQAGEVSITRARIEASVGQIKGSLGDLNDNLERLRLQLRDIEFQAETQMSSRMEAAKAASETFDALEFDRFTRFQELTRMMAESVNDVATVQRTLQRAIESAEDGLVAQARLARDLQDDLLRTRMVEFESLSDRLYRVVRQAAKETGKAVRLDIVGGAVEVDRGVLDRMTAAFEHLLRNCVTHGIEAPEARTAAGKDPTGNLVVALSHEGNEVGVEFRDDGRGLDLEAIRRKAEAMGLVEAGSEPSVAALALLIFEPGFTTAETVTELAGRGVGMDVVRAEVNAMGGRIETATAAGQGTSFKLILPLTTAVTQVVMLRCGDLTVAVPSTLVEIVRRATVAEIDAAYASGSYALAERNLPFFWLGALLQSGSTPGESSSRTRPVVVIKSAQQRIAVHVDDVLGNHEVVVKNLGPQLARLPGLAGVTLLASGAVALIYNPVALATLYGDAARGATPAAVSAANAGAAVVNTDRTAAPPTPAEPLVMVVDDSLTVRRVTQRLLAREGYRVVLAKDGVDALAQLADELPQVVLSDIEMPRMDGFDLVRNLRADPRLRELPVVMITSRIAQKHREYAAQLGVDHYLGKPYAEDELLALVAHYARSRPAVPERA